MNDKKTWPQPHEGIIGIQRDDPWLSEDEALFPVQTLIRSLVSHLQDAILVGDPAPRVRRMQERLIRNAQIGDLVVECSTFYKTDPRSITRGLGYLVAEREEWWQTDEDYEADQAINQAEWDKWAVDEAQPPEPYVPEERSTDHAWYVQYGNSPEDICRWTNCSFLTVPVDPRMFSDPIGTRTGNGVTVTRNDLVGSMVDAGFKLR